MTRFPERGDNFRLALIRATATRDDRRCNHSYRDVERMIGVVTRQGEGSKRRRNRGDKSSRPFDVIEVYELLRVEGTRRATDQGAISDFRFTGAV